MTNTVVILYHKYFQLSLSYASVIFEKVYAGTTGFVKERELQNTLVIRTERTSHDLQEQLLRQCLDGNRKAQQRLYLMYAPRFLNIAYRVVWHREDAQDVVQDSFLKIFNSLDGLKEVNKFEGWAKRIVVNNAITLLRQKGKMPTYDLDTTFLPIPSEEKTDEDLQQWSVAIAREALSKLAPGYRTVISLYLLEGYDHQEISEILGISVSTSITQFNRGKKRLREMVEKISSAQLGENASSRISKR